jgi:hypothetical protein
MTLSLASCFHTSKIVRGPSLTIVFNTYEQALTPSHRIPRSPKGSYKILSEAVAINTFGVATYCQHDDNSSCTLTSTVHGQRQHQA